MTDYLRGVMAGRKAYQEWAKLPGTKRPLCPHERESELGQGWLAGWEMENLAGDY